MLRGIAADRKVLERAAEPGWPASTARLVVWAKGDRVMPPDHGRRLAADLPRARLVVVPDSYTLLPLDQPADPRRRPSARLVPPPLTAGGVRRRRVRQVVASAVTGPPPRASLRFGPGHRQRGIRRQPATRSVGVHRVDTGAERADLGRGPAQELAHVGHHREADVAVDADLGQRALAQGALDQPAVAGAASRSSSSWQ